jgi:hypothetical protein
MRLQSLVVPAVLAALATSSAQAENAGRYRLEKSADGYVRMDTQTGEMSLCGERSGQLVCKSAADERTAFQDEIERLQGTVKGLDERIARLENSLAARLESSLPSEEDFNKTMSYMERFLRSFMGIVKDLNKDDAGNDGPSPQKT